MMYMIVLAWISISAVQIARLVDCELSGRGRGMLYPQESESRQIQLLDGMWNFRADRSDCRCEGLMQHWYLKPLFQVLFVHELYKPTLTLTLAYL